MGELEVLLAERGRVDYPHRHRAPSFLAKGTRHSLTPPAYLMDQPKRPSEKTYSDVMNEWAAQRHFVNANRSRILHPPYDAHPVAKFIGYLWRVMAVLVVPLVIYGVILRFYLRSKEFNAALGTGIARTLTAKKAEVHGAMWKTDGILSVMSLQADGGPDAFYEALDARTIGARLPFASLFRKEWILPRVSIGELSLALRSGGIGKVPLYQPEADAIQLPSTGEAPKSSTPKTGALRQLPADSLTAGYGVKPEVAALQINSLQASRLNVNWGTGPATSGAITGMQTDFTKTTTGWLVSGNGGEFRQAWLDRMKVDKLNLQLGQTEAVIQEANFSRTGGGRGSFAGRVSLGEIPEVTGVMQLEGVALHDLVPAAAGGFFTAEIKGALNLTGSVNRATGIRMEGDLEVVSGRINALPVLKVLEHLTGENQFRLLSLRSGRIRFTSSGAESHGGMVVEVNDFEADCGALLRLKGNLRHEVIPGTATLEGKTTPDNVIVTGVVKLGLAPSLAAQLKPALAARYLKAGSEGWSWLDIEVNGPLNSNFTRALADEILKASKEAP